MSTPQHIYFLGIGGTLMGSLAQLAQQMGYRVSGSDAAADEATAPGDDDDDDVEIVYRS